MRAGLYLRVSTARQRDLGTSLETQEAACRAAAGEAGYSVLDTHVFQDVYTGSTLDRPALSRLRHAVRQRDIEAVWIYDTDRLARDPTDLLTILREFSDHDVIVRSVRKTLSTGPDADLIAFIDGWVAEQERSSILRRSKDGKRQAANNGYLVIGDSRGIYGYDYIPETKSRVINHPEAKVIREIFSRAKCGESWYSIAKDLQQRGVPTKRGGTWDSATVKAIVHRTSYYGLDLYGRTRMEVMGGEAKRVKTPEAVWIRITGYSPPIISQQDYEAAHLAVAARTAQPTRKISYLLTGYARCGLCGGPVSGRSRLYYRCSRAKARGSYPSRCDARHIRREELESWVWETVCASIRDPRTIFSILSPGQRRDSDQIDAEIATMRRSLRQNERQQDQLLDLWESDEDGQSIPREALAVLKAEWDDLQDAIDTLGRQRNDALDRADRAAHFSAICGQIRSRLDSLTPSEFREILSAFGVRITASRDQAECEIFIDPDTRTVGI